MTEADEKIIRENKSFLRADKINVQKYCTSNDYLHQNSFFFIYELKKWVTLFEQKKSTWC